MNNETQEKKWMKICRIILNVVFYVLIAILLVFSITNLTRKDNLEVASIFGRGYCTVATDSMTGDNKDSFTSKDLILVKKVTERNRQKIANKLEIGDIITFVWKINDQDSLNTHRIVNIFKNSNGDVIYFVTQGDANAKTSGEYNSSTDDRNACETVYLTALRGVYTGKIKGLGQTMKFLQTANGFLLCVVLPMACIFIVMLSLLVLNIVNIRKAKSDEQHAAEMEELKAKQAQMLEEEKARIRAEILAEQQGAKPAEAEPQAEESAEEPVEEAPAEATPEEAAAEEQEVLEEEDPLNQELQ